MGNKTIKVKHDRCQGKADTSAVTQEPMEIYVDSYGRMRIRGRRAVPTGVISESSGDPYLGIEEEWAIPKKLKLAINPNPFNSSVTITASRDAEITIFDISGRIVVCFDGGRNTDIVKWRPRPDRPSGVYFIQSAVNDVTVCLPALYLK